MTADVRCLSCQTPLTWSLVDLGLSPLANSFIKLPQPVPPPPEKTYPLHARVCPACLLVQVEKVVSEDHIFSDYAYFSSFSDSWLAHARAYCDMVVRRFGLDRTSFVMEIASNDGYLLQNFVQRGIPCLGIEPAANVAAAARDKGVPTRVEFFGRGLAERLVDEGVRPDLIVSKNVLAHVPDINDFVAGVATLLGGDGVYTVEFPHLLTLIEHVEFDTIYHEHFSYLSLLAVERIFTRHGLRVFDIEEVPTHGGSLRVFACRQAASFPTFPGVAAVRGKELAARLDQESGYQGFAARVDRVRDDLRSYLQAAKAAGRRVAAYGAAAKGNTLLNYCAIGTDLIAYVVDRNPTKQNTLLPGSHIPVSPVSRLDDEPADDILILPWNLRDELVKQLEPYRARGSRLVTAIPRIDVTT